MIGAGNLATQLALAMKRNGIRVVQVYNRTPGNGKLLAKKLGAAFVPDPSEITGNADLYVLSVSDKAISQVAQMLSVNNHLVIHTSGSVNMDALLPASNRVGVWYPLQTFSKLRRISFRGIPVCVESNQLDDLQLLMELGKTLSGDVHVIDSKQRKIIHMTAVFANNFTNFMYTIAEDLLRRHNIPFDLLKPLILQTAENAECEALFSQQTGPAIREDQAVMNEHLGMLAQHAVYMEIYDLISKSIIKYKNANG